MPIYSYVCKDCGNKFDLLVGVNSEKVSLKCSKCKSKNIHKMMGTFSVGEANSKFNSSCPSCSTDICPSCPTYPGCPSCIGS